MPIIAVVDDDRNILNSVHLDGRCSGILGEDTNTTTLTVGGPVTAITASAVCLA
jgi:hypothetical protein